MSYFPSDIPYMSNDELQENGVNIPKEDTTPSTEDTTPSTETHACDSISRQFKEILVRYPPEDECAYPEYKGKPYFTVLYEENGEKFVGFGTYNPEVLSRYLRDYFMPSVQPNVPDINVGDIISRQAAKEAYCTHFCHRGVLCPDFLCKEVNEAFDSIPSVQPVSSSCSRENDLISRQTAIDAVDKIGHVATMTDGDKVIRRSAVKYVLSMLPSTQSEQLNCPYCHEDSDGHVKPIEKNCHAFVRFGMDGWKLNLKAKGWRGEAKINYCPMCGRRLVHG